MWRRIRREQRDRATLEEELGDAEELLAAGDTRTALRRVERTLREVRALEDGEALLAFALTVRAAALNDLGRFRGALAAAEEACRADPEDAAGEHERGTALYRLGRFDDAVLAFRAEVALAPEDAHAWQMLGRSAVWIEDRALADEAFRWAASLDPDAYTVPVRIAAGEFDRIAAEVWRSIPANFRALLENAIVTVEPLPPLDDVENGFDPDTLGAYEGASALHSGGFPERIVLFQRNHENVCSSLGELREEIRRTILHEVGHHFGMEEGEMPY